MIVDKKLTTLMLGAVVAIASTATWAAQSSDTLTIGVQAPPLTMNPQGADTDPNMSMMTNIFDGLLRRNDDGKLEPDLATSWERVDDTTWRFHLRKGVKFQNGNDFDWQDVRFTFKRLKDPKVSEYLNFGELVKSVEPADGNPWIIDITTTKSVPFFAQNLPQIFIMDQKSTESRSQGDVGLHPIGTGPYRMTKWVKGSYLTFEAYDEYWGDSPSIQHVKVLPITEDSTRMAAISTGQVDILQGVPVTLIDAIKNRPDVKIIQRPGRRAFFLQMTNNKGTPTADLRVRKAMYMTIDDDAIINSILHGHAKSAAQIPDPPTIGYSKKIKRLSYNRSKAEKLLTEAGYPDGFRIRFTGTNEDSISKQVEANIAAQLSKVGIQVDVDSVPKAIFYSKLAKHEMDFYIFGWFDGAYDFGRTFSKLMHSVSDKGGYGSANGGSYASQALDKQFAKANRIIDPAKREKALQKLNEMAAAEVAFIPLYYKENDYAVNTDKTIDFTPRADTWLVFKNISIE